MTTDDNTTTDEEDTREERIGDIEMENSTDPATRVSMLGHLYRGEIDRATSWRSRLDQTTNWAVVLVAAILTWAFSSPDNPHYVLLIAMFGVVGFLLIEGHRFQEYDIWRQRVRLLQIQVFVPLITGRPPSDSGWKGNLADSLESPSMTMSLSEAVGHRLRRTYLALLSILLAAWAARITVFHPDEGWRESASIPGVGGEVVVIVVAIFYLSILGLAGWSAYRGGIREIRE